MMPLNEAIGTAAGALTTLAFVPQAFQVWRSKSAKDINLVTFSMFSAGVALWLVFGIMIGSVSVIVTNAVTLLLALAILFLKIFYAKSRTLPGDGFSPQSSSKLPDHEER
jgi:MtN3 and saliva related transmembrane protein